MFCSMKRVFWPAAARVCAQMLLGECAKVAQFVELKFRADKLFFVAEDAFGSAGAADGGVVGDEALAIEVVKAVVHEDHAFLAPHLNGVVQLMELVLADHVADAVGGDEQLIGKHAPVAVGGGEQILRDDALQ